MEKVIVFGGSGLLGVPVVKKLREKFVVVAPTRQEFDLSRTADYKGIRTLIQDNMPAFVVNCSGVLPKEAGLDPRKAFAVNTTFPVFMAEVCRGMNIPFIHISTNCVFSGGDHWYLSSHGPDAGDVYGMSKGVGEVGPDCIIIRTSFIGVPTRENDTGLLGWFLKNPDKEVAGYNVEWNGVTNLEIADRIEEFSHYSNGIYHFMSEGAITKARLLSIANDVFHTGHIIVEKEGGGLPKLLVPDILPVESDWTKRMQRMKEEAGWCK